MSQPAFRTGVTLQDILERPDFELACIAATDRPPDVTVRGIHMTDVPQPEQWLAEGWVLMTAGLQVRGRPAQQRRLIQRLADQGVAGLGYCVGIATRRVPQAMVGEAQRLDFPLFVVPYHVPVRIIIAEVNKMLLESADGLLGRSLATYDYLLAGFDASLRTNAFPERQLVVNLSSLLEVPVEYYGATGSPQGTGAAVFDLPPDAFDALSRHSVTKLSRGPGSHLVCPCTLNGQHTGWLVTRTPVNPAHETFVAAAMSATARLVSLSAVSRAHQPAVSHSLRGQLLDLLLDDTAGTAGSETVLTGAHDRARLLALLTGLGFLPDRDIHVLVCRPASSDRARPGVLERALSEEGYPYLIRHSERSVTIVVQGSGQRLTQLLPAPTMFGLAGPLRDIFLTRDAVQRAMFALRCVDAGLVEPTRRHAHGGGYVAVDHLPLSLWAAEQLRDPESMARAHHLVRSLRQQPLVFEAVRSYLQHRQSIPATADALHLHPNSLRSRLRRADRILGGPIRDPLVLSSIYIALAVDDRFWEENGAPGRQSTVERLVRHGTSAVAAVLPGSLRNPADSPPSTGITAPLT